MQARFHVNGHVQGVAFRVGAQSEARRLGLGGWVANRRDGSVAGMVCGAAGVVEAFRAWLQQGPPAARVEAVEWEVLDGDPAAPAETGDFSIAPDLP